MINSREDVITLLNNLDYIKIVPSYYEESKDYSDSLCYLKYLNINELKKDNLKEFVVLDTETTGLGPKFGDKMVQITAIKFVDFKPTQIFTSLINPRRYIPLSVSKIHGITNEMVEFSPVFNEIKDQLGEFLKNQKIIGHNIMFDLRFLMSEGLNLLDLDIEVIDTLQIARASIDKGYIENYKLSSLCKYFCLDYFNYHNATEDVLGTSYVFLNLLNMIFIDDTIMF